jgi:hypothetical protein
VKVELLITASHFFPLKELCKKNTQCINHRSGRTIKKLNSFVIEHHLATALSLVLHLIYDSCLVIVVTCFSGVLIKVYSS